MKKQIFLLFALATISLSANAQNAFETFAYLRTYYSTLPGVHKDSPSTSIQYKDVAIDTINGIASGFITIKQCTTSRDGKCTVYRSDNVILKSIIGLKIYHIEYKKISEYKYQNETYGLAITQNDTIDVISISTAPSSKDDFEKFKRALTRLAVLAGAKIADADLFDK